MIMDEPIEGLYFNWLCAKVLSVEIPIYYELMRILYGTEFVWLVPGDQNRADDGLELREDFLRETTLYSDPEWFNSECSILEVLIAFAKRARFQTGTPTKEWFWEFLTNLGLDEFRQVSKTDRLVIDDILHDFVWRTYNSNGHGGIFPLRWPKHDQREVEIWYQFTDYLIDQGRL